MAFESNASLSEAAVRGLLEIRAADRRGRRGSEPTLFLMDRDLVVRGAAGESILRLPWFDDELFVGRQLPDIAEMPHNVRGPAVAHYPGRAGG